MAEVYLCLPLLLLHHQQVQSVLCLTCGGTLHIRAPPCRSRSVQLRRALLHLSLRNLYSHAADSLLCIAYRRRRRRRQPTSPAGFGPALLQPVTAWRGEAAAAVGRLFAFSWAVPSRRRATCCTRRHACKIYVRLEHFVCLPVVAVTVIALHNIPKPFWLRLQLQLQLWPRLRLRLRLARGAVRAPFEP